VNNIAMNDGQAPARRIGALIAIIITCVACSCIVGSWYLFAREGVNTLFQSISLAGEGITTTGTVTDMEEFTGGKASFPSTSYRLTVSFNVDGQTYRLKSNAYYKLLGKSWMGETMPIIYDPDDPNRALIDTFQERWLQPITNSAP